jgi:hypothetical protein
VRGLHIHCDLDDRGDPHQEYLRVVVQEDWARAWAVLGKMTSLRHLHIIFACNIWNQPEEIEVLWAPVMTEVLKPIGTITAPSEFTIRLPDWRCSTDFEIGDSKCVVKLPDKPVVDANDGSI